MIETIRKIEIKLLELANTNLNQQQIEIVQEIANLIDKGE